MQKAQKIKNKRVIKMYLFFDTETTGLAKNLKAPESDLNNWPRLVQIGWLHYNKTEKQIAKNSRIIKPNGFIIPDEAIKKHGISNERAKKEGVALKQVLNEFSSILRKSKFLIAHNVKFDKGVVGSEFLRTDIKNNLSDIKKICTLESSTDFCEIPGPYGYKWPNLPELHMKLFNIPIKESHNALLDAETCAKCFFELVKKGVIKLNL